MKRTKIVCTMGPNTDNREIMKQLALNGMDVARFNFSHGDYEEHRNRLAVLESVRAEDMAIVSAQVYYKVSGRTK